MPMICKMESARGYAVFPSYDENLVLARARFFRAWSIV